MINLKELNIDYEGIREYDCDLLPTNTDVGCHIIYKGNTLYDGVGEPITVAFDVKDNFKHFIRIKYKGIEKIKSSKTLDEKFIDIDNGFVLSVMACLQEIVEEFKWKIYMKPFEKIIDMKVNNCHLIINYERFKLTKYKGWLQEEIYDVYLNSYRNELIPVFNQMKVNMNSKLYLYEERKEKIDPLKLYECVSSNAFQNKNIISHLFPALLYKKWSLEKNGNFYITKSIKSSSDNIEIAISKIIS